MTNTLRKEIKKVLNDFADYRETEKEYLTFKFDEHSIDRILKLIEKRIDEMMTKYNPIKSGYQTGYYNATCEFKRMLK